MKKFLFDTNVLSNQIFKEAHGRHDFFIIQDVLDESTNTKEEYKRAISSGLNIVHITGKHLEKLKEIMNDCGDNFDLIRLYTGEGTADILMLAYVMYEQERGVSSLFPDNWILVTEDKALRETASNYNIVCFSTKEFFANEDEK